jgi:acylphosphatase
MKKEEVCVHCIIAGKVQGVWFRASTQTEANQLGVTGWVRNLGDGSVEVIACGPKADIDLLCEWLKKGPPRAYVKDFFCEEIPSRNYQGFDIL